MQETETEKQPAEETKEAGPRGKTADAAILDDADFVTPESEAKAEPKPKPKPEPPPQLELEVGGDEEGHAIIAIIENRFIYKKETQRETSSDEVVAILQFDGPVAHVRRGYGLTLNLSNYESARLDVSVTVPCYLADVDVADEWARQWVERRVVHEVENVRGKGSTDGKPSY